MYKIRCQLLLNKAATSRRTQKVLRAEWLNGGVFKCQMLAMKDFLHALVLREIQEPKGRKSREKQVKASELEAKVSFAECVKDRV